MNATDKVENGKITQVADYARPLSPPIKTAGGKAWLVPKLRELYEPHRARRLVEPFVGGMSVALGLQPNRALLADANPHLMTFWRRLCNPQAFVLPMENDRETYLAARRDFNTMVLTAANRFDPLVGELFYYLNRTCFNGLFRVNSRGEFNVPFGKYKTITYRRDFSEYAPILRGWGLRYRDFETLFRFEIEANDFVYIDPPYDGGFVAYTPEGFGWDRQVTLAECFAAHPGPVVASNLGTDRILKLYHRLGYAVALIDAPRRISAKGDRTPVKEMLAFRNIEYQAPDALPGQTTLKIL